MFGLVFEVALRTERQRGHQHTGAHDERQHDADHGGPARTVHGPGRIEAGIPLVVGREAGGAITLFLATALGVPVSTTHTITGAIVGVGAARRVSAVRWNVASSIVYAWVITIPASAGVAALAYWSLKLLPR